MTNKYKYFVANWKMFGELKSVKSINKVINFSKRRIFNKARIIYCPPYTLINIFINKLKKSKIYVGAQNCHFKKDNGPHTGSISSKMIKDLGCRYVIVGHSENRQEGETDLLLNKKIQSCLKNSLKIIFCIGENLKEKKNKKTNKILFNQITKGLKGIKNINNIIIAYEPVWSIGTGVIPKKKELKENIFFIKKILKNKFKKKYFSVLYGGSVSPDNIKELKDIKEIDGFLIGGSSQDSKKFIDIIKKTYI